MRMSFEEFKGEILHRRGDFLPDEMKYARLEIQPVNKLNSSYEALVIRTPDDVVGASINLNNLYESCREAEIEDAVDRLRDTVASLEYDAIKELTESGEVLQNYASVKNNLFLRCSNTARNESILQNCPHQEKDGLTLTVNIGLKWEENTVPKYSAVVTNDILNHWDISAEKLFADAMENAQKRMPATIRRLSDVLFQMAGGDVPEREPDEPDIYVLSNGITYNGAAAAYYPEMLNKAHDKLGDFYMLPSSVHEWLLLPDAMGMHVNELERMVRDVNRYEVSDADFLSDDVYHFNGEKMELARNYENRIYKNATMDYTPAPSVGEEEKTADVAFTM